MFENLIYISKIYIYKAFLIQISMAHNPVRNCYTKTIYLNVISKIET